jgi:hypothetical protein
MTSVLNVDSIAAKDGTSAVTLTKQTAAKAFSVVDATASNAILKSFNISSISDIAVGIINNSFTNSMADVNYHNLASADVNTVAPCTGATASAYDTTSSARGYAYRTDTSALVDQDKIGPLIHGDLA